MQLIKKHKPIEVLECGPGVTTVVIANALRENFDETGLQGKITCMENHKEWYEMAYEILPNEFKEITGCPVIVNTSFNVRGEPIVNTPTDAFNCFMGTELDYLVIGNCILDKTKQDPKLKKDYTKEFELD